MQNKNFGQLPSFAGLTIITSCGCNLDCSYCKIAQARHNNKNATILQDSTINALKDNSFLMNTQQVLYKLNQSPRAITGIALWGQEPTLTLNLLTDNIQSWLTTFPNWNNCSFSTNGVAYIERLSDFVFAIDDNINHPFDIDIQLSYDGEYSTTNLRKTSGSNIYDNVETLINILNGHRLKNVNLHLHFHAVLSIDLLHKLQTAEDIVNYERPMILWTNHFAEMVTNPRVHMEPEMDIGLENPVFCSREEGMLLERVLQISQELSPTALFSEKELQSLHYYTLHDRVIAGSFYLLETVDRIMHERFSCNNLDQLLDLVTVDTKARNDFCRELNKMCYCGNGYGELKVMYDGTLVNCQNHIYDLDLDQLPIDNTSIEASVKRSLAQHNYFVNPLTVEDDMILKRYFDLFNSMKTSSLEFMWKNNVSEMALLLDANQIDPSYHDIRKLARHALIMAVYGCCSYNNQITTGSVYLRHTGVLRFYCNGYLDLCCNSFNNMKGDYIL